MVKKVVTLKECRICGKMSIPFALYDDDSCLCEDCEYKIFMMSEKQKSNITTINSNSFLKLRFEIFKRDKFSCKYCGRNVKSDEIKLVIDHIIPVNKKGKNHHTNLITSCSECNLGKSDVLLNNLKYKQIKVKTILKGGNVNGSN